MKLTVRSCTSLEGSRATGHVSLVRSSMSSSLLLLESKTTRKQEKSGMLPNYHQNIPRIILGILSGSINTNIRLNYTYCKKTDT